MRYQCINLNCKNSVELEKASKKQMFCPKCRTLMIEKEASPKTKIDKILEKISTKEEL